MIRAFFALVLFLSMAFFVNAQGRNRFRFFSQPEITYIGSGMRINYGCKECEPREIPIRPEGVPDPGKEIIGSDAAPAAGQIPAAPVDEAQDSKLPAPIQPEELERHGVDWDKILPHRVTFSGRTITCETAMDRIGKQVPNDRGNLRLTVIGTKTETDKVRKSVSAYPQEMRDRLTVWACSADHWSLKDTSNGKTVFAVGGNPTWYVQAPDGLVIHRSEVWDDTTAPEAIRKAIKAYDAKKDPDLSKKKSEPAEPDKSKKTPGGNDSGFSLTAFAVGAGLVLLYLKGKQ